MFKEIYNVIGVMSGTSLDGVDLAYISFKKNPNWEFEIICAATIPYSEDWIERLKNGMELSKDALNSLNEK